MTEAEARALAACVAAGAPLRLKWETQWELCWCTVRHDVDRGFVAALSELPHDVLSPWRDHEKAWSEAELVAVLTSLAADAVESGSAGATDAGG